MTLTSTKSWRNYVTLCAMLNRNDIPFERNDRELSVRCYVNTSVGEGSFVFRIDPSKMLISLCSPVEKGIDGDRIQDIALALAVINSRLDDGCFCLDTRECLLYYRMTSSFCESNVSGSVFEYMLSRAADAAERYTPRLRRLASSLLQ